MDEIVKAALAKWPNVPDCHGWLGLDSRGNWFLRDYDAQRAGSFSSGLPGSRGQRLEHEKLQAFICRNYEHDAAGRWYFQNGPQRVYVELEAAPWVLRLQPDGTLLSHTGVAATCLASWLDEQGRLYAETVLGLGLVHSQDMHLAADWVEQGRWSPQDCLASELPQRFGFILSPQEAAG
jgi:Protein of unknown function (DUF2946)